MKVLQSSIFRAFCSIAIGALLIKYRGETVTWLTVTIGALFLLSGIISCATYFIASRKSSEYKITDAQGNVVNYGKPTFPIVGLGSIILGFLLTITPSVFVTALMYILGAMLILGAINQFMVLASIRRIGALSFFYWICPSLILLTGIYVIVKPMESAEVPLLIIGWCLLLYGVTEMINAMKMYLQQRRYKKMIAEQEAEATAEAVEITEESAEIIEQDEQKSLPE